MKKFVPWIFLTILVALGAFLGGIQYGKSVQDVNEALEYIRSNMPLQQTVQPTMAPPEYSFRTITDDVCNISFTVPESLKVSSNEGKIQYLENNDPVFSYSCSATGEADLILKDSSFTTSTLLEFPYLEEEMTASVSAENETSPQSQYYFVLEQEENLVEFIVQKRYIPLISTSLRENE